MNELYGAWRITVQRGVMVFLLFALFAGAASAAAGKTVLVLGDSLSAGYGIAANQSWVALTEKRIQARHPGWRVVNASISGETTSGGASRIGAEIARSRPAVVVIELGANDGLRGLALAQTRSNLEQMIKASRQAKARVLLIGMRLPPNFGPQYTRGFEKNYADLAKRYETAFVPFFLAPIASSRSAFQADNLHPTAASQPKLRDHIWPALQPLLK